MSFEFNRNIQDKNYTSTVAIAQAGANTAAFDLEQAVGGDIERVVFSLSAPTAAGISDTKVVTYALQDSADGSSWAAVDPAISTTQTGASSAGIVAKEVRFRVPANTRRYVRIAQTMTASAGTVTGSMVAKLLF
jgi:hypothetical protein